MGPIRSPGLPRRTFIEVVAGGLLAAPLAAQAQPVVKVHRIGLLNGTTPGRPEAAFREGLRALGYVEGGNVLVDSRGAQGRAERLPALARELLDAKPAVIVTFGTAAAAAMKAATTTTPIVMAFAGDPVGRRLVASLAKPGGNVTGMSLATPELAGKQLEFVKEVVPKLTRLTILGTSPDRSTRRASLTLPDGLRRTWRRSSRERGPRTSPSSSPPSSIWSSTSRRPRRSA